MDNKTNLDFILESRNNITKRSKVTTGSWTILMITCLLTLVPLSMACSCLQSHPQEHYCSSDFVSLVEVKKVASETKSSTTYSIQVRKEFKTKGKGHDSLASSGMFYTPSHETSCGRTFQPNTRYLITGRIINGQAWVSLCNYVEEWSKMTNEQRKGFKKWYSIGCSCSIRNGPNNLLQMKRNSLKKGQLISAPSKTCSWDTKFEGDLDCQGLHSICVPISSPEMNGSLKRRSLIGQRRMNNGRRDAGSRRFYLRRTNPGQVVNDIETESVLNEPNCHWIPSLTYRECMRNRTEQSDLHHQILKKYEETRTVKLREP